MACCIVLGLDEENEGQWRGKGWDLEPSWGLNVSSKITGRTGPIAVELLFFWKLSWGHLPCTVCVFDRVSLLHFACIDFWSLGGGAKEEGNDCCCPRAICTLYSSIVRLLAYVFDNGGWLSFAFHYATESSASLQSSVLSCFVST